MTLVERLSADELFRRVYQRCRDDKAPFLLDVRKSKKFRKAHLPWAFNIAVTSTGALADFSHNNYEHQRWSDRCWYGESLIVYGDKGLDEDHPVVRYLRRDGQSERISIFRGGFEELEGRYPFLPTKSVSSSGGRLYPAQIDDCLYLGDWNHASDQRVVADFGIRRVLTVHNNPEGLDLSGTGVRRLNIAIADTDGENIGQHFERAIEFIDAAVACQNPVLVHCGSGVSRSATIAIAYLVTKKAKGPAEALAQCKQRRRVAIPNRGFWKQVCDYARHLGRDVDESALEGTLGREEKPNDEVVDPLAVSRWASGTAKQHRQDSSSGTLPWWEGEAWDVSEGADAQSLMKLVIVRDGGEELESRDLPERGEFRVGRADGDLLLDHISVSRRHARIKAKSAGEYAVEDLGSSHGTCVNGQALPPHKERRLEDGDVISFGVSSRVAKFRRKYPVAKSQRRE